jgi:hypothetical protein
VVHGEKRGIPQELENIPNLSEFFTFNRCNISGIITFYSAGSAAEKQESCIRKYLQEV